MNKEEENESQANAEIEEELSCEAEVQRVLTFWRGMLIACAEQRRFLEEREAQALRALRELRREHPGVA